jgi:pimeloyl-ACP methyl ester carboxylesterase
MAIILLTLTISIFLNSANGQRSPCDNGTIIRSIQSLPVILVHGWAEDSSIWLQWEKLLKENSIPFCTVTFQQSPSGDTCGSAADHANELAQIVEQVKTMTGQNQVNIVAHSKGGLDTRLYLAQSGSPDVANLVMIGTPNGGDPLADEGAQSIDPFNVTCRPALFDLETGAYDTTVENNPHTNYYTIYGIWNPSLDCPLNAYENLGFNELMRLNAGPNDGIVPLLSSESLSNFTNLGHTDHCHTGLLTSDEYTMARSVLMH